MPQAYQPDPKIEALDPRHAGPLWPPIPAGDPPDRRPKGAPWHVGCMVTQARAVAVAVRLFPEEAATGDDCRAKIGREGEPCRACAERNAAWSERVRAVRLAMLAGFA